MAESLVVVYEQAPIAEVKSYRGDYTLSVPGGTSETLKRDEDFGLILKKDGKPAVNKPILFKQGADKVFKSFGAFVEFERVSSIERFEEKNPFAYYAYKAIAFVYYGEEKKRLNVSWGVGNANTGERSSGFGSVYDLANSAEKKAKKRAYVDCAINLAKISGLFSQDQENEDFMKKADEVVNLKEDSPVTTAQMRRIYALGSNAGLTQTEIKHKIVAAGYTSTKDIKQKDYEAVCALFQNGE